jgi:hypothetical protein
MIIDHSESVEESSPAPGGAADEVVFSSLGMPRAARRASCNRAVVSPGHSTFERFIYL